MLAATRYRTTVEIARQTALSGEIGRLQESISSGKRISVASDDPVAAGRISEIRQAQADAAVWSRNIGTGSALAAEGDDKLQAVATLVDRAKELVLQGRNQATSDADRAALAAELRGLAADVQTYATATDDTGHAIFPETSARAVPVSDTQSLAPTALRATIFDQVPLATGPTPLATILGNAATQLEGTDPTQRDGDLASMLDTLDTTAQHVATMRADQGILAQRFDDARARLGDTSQSLAEERSGLEDTDLSTAISAFQAKSTALQAAQAVFAQTSKSGLFDLIG